MNNKEFKFDERLDHAIATALIKIIVMIVYLTVL